MVITASLVNELRQKTGAGMMDCKKALTEADGDFEKAIEILRKKGASVAAKRAEKTANEGLVLTNVSDDKKTGIIVEVNCETDFVAKSKDFVDMATDVLGAIKAKKPADLDQLMQDQEISGKLSDVMGKVGEKIQVSRFAMDNSADALFVDYIHMGSKLGVLLKFVNVADSQDELAQLGKDIAMQVAAMKPLTVYRDEVSKDIIDKELDIYKELARKEGKPENILDKIAQGRLNKFYQENCLTEQAFIKDNTKTVGDLVKEYNSKSGATVKIGKFYRFHLGDEKK